MAKKKKRKLKIFRLFLVLFIFAIFAAFIYFLSTVKVKGFYISGNTYYTDQEILIKTGLDKYPSYLLTSSYSINRKIKHDKLIQSIKLKKTLKGKFKLIVNESKVIYYDTNIKKSVLNDGSEIDFYYEYSPVLVNKIDNKKIYASFLSKFSKISSEISKNISEIKYDPNELDKERFLFSMNDGNYVYVTLSKMSNIENYLEISKTLDNRNGILYLDYGNYFVPKE